MDIATLVLANKVESKAIFMGNFRVKKKSLLEIGD